jgi:hypothetical protein
MRPAGANALLEKATSAHPQGSGHAAAALHDTDARPGFFRQTRVLIPRAHKNVYRNYPVLLGLVAQGTVLGLIMGFTFFRLPDVRVYSAPWSNMA